MHQDLPSPGNETSFLSQEGIAMIETDRLLVRPFRDSDYRDLYEYLSLEETYRYEPGNPVRHHPPRLFACGGEGVALQTLGALH